jgi:Xaa-Pro aminopeptidase
MAELGIKQDRIQALLEKRHLDALLLRRVSSFAWATCGAASHVNTAVTNGEASLPITPSGRHLIATDERVFAFRHPLPTGKKLKRYAMLVLCGRRWGLVCSVTRLVHFGRLPDELRRKAEAVARVVATSLAATRPGQTPSQVFQRATAAYAECGCPAEWQRHHQGGPAGYEPREYIATPHCQDLVKAGQVYAWNPSIAGTKSEDTILVTSSGTEVLTSIDGWPLLSVVVGDAEYARPAILEVL